jgi:Ca2+-binding RTX toxin-like protein
MKKLLLILGVAIFPAIANAANQTFIFSGTMQSVSTTLTNPYSLATLAVSGMYNVNNGIYAGQGTGNQLLMTNSSDFITLDSGGVPNVQTVSGVQRIVTGNGNDIVDMASANFTLPAITIFGGTGNQTIWANSGDTTINAGPGTNTLCGGPGNDTINGGTGNDTIDGGTGNNTVNSGGGDDSLTYNALKDVGTTDIFNGGTGTDTLVLQLTAAEGVSDAADIAAAQAFITANYDPTSSTGPTYTFSSFDLTFSNVESLDVQIAPEPSALCLIGAAVAGLGMRGNRRRKN